jgi:hypothetical protein
VWREFAANRVVQLRVGQASNDGAACFIQSSRNLFARCAAIEFLYPHWAALSTDHATDSEELCAVEHDAGSLEYQVSWYQNFRGSDPGEEHEQVA